MSAQAKMWIEYLGGPDVLWLMLVVIAVTQLVKMVLKARGHFTPAAIRPVPYVVGAVCGLQFISFTSRGAMIGMAAGMVASFAFFAVTVRLEAGSWKAAGQRMADRMLLK